MKQTFNSGIHLSSDKRSKRFVVSQQENKIIKKLYCAREQHRNMYTIKDETDYRPRLDAWDKHWDLVLWEDLEGAGGEGGGRGDWDGEDMWTQGLFISMYDKIHYK